MRFNGHKWLGEWYINIVVHIAAHIFMYYMYTFEKQPNEGKS